MRAWLTVSNTTRTSRLVKEPGATYQDGRQPPEVQLLGGQPVRLALGAVVELVLPELLLAGECFQTAVQADGLGLGPAGLLHTAVLLHDLQGHRRKYTGTNTLQKMHQVQPGSS